MAGTPLKNLKLFKKLCGDDYFSRIFLTTTMWTDSEEDKDEPMFRDRQADLEATYWAPIIAKGAKTRQFRGTRQSALDILREVIVTAAKHKKRQILEIQEELVDLSKRLPATKAGRQLHTMVEELVERQTNLLDRLRRELVQTSDPEMLRQLVIELNDIRQEREKALKDMQRLDLSLTERIRRLVLWATRGQKVWIQSMANRLHQLKSRLLCLRSCIYQIVFGKNLTPVQRVKDRRALSRTVVEIAKSCSPGPFTFAVYARFD
jgi:hypothetical protein